MDGYFAMNRIMPSHVFKVGNVLVKKCSGCGVSRELEKFQSKPGYPGGVDNLCQHCRRPIERSYQQSKKSRQ